MFRLREKQTQGGCLEELSACHSIASVLVSRTSHSKLTGCCRAPWMWLNSSPESHFVAPPPRPRTRQCLTLSRPTICSFYTETYWFNYSIKHRSLHKDEVSKRCVNEMMVSLKEEPCLDKLAPFIKPQLTMENVIGLEIILYIGWHFVTTKIK